MKPEQISAFAGSLAPIVKDFVASKVAPLVERVAALEARPLPKSGEPGLPGKDADPARLDAVERAVEAVAAATAELAGRAPPEAKEPTPEALQAAVTKHLEANPAPAGEPGKNADPVTPAEIADAVAKFFVANPVEVPKDGKDAAPEQIAAAVAEHLKANPPKDGESIKGDEGRGVRELLIDAEGQLVATYTDGVVKAVGRVKGTDGKSADPSEVAELRRLVTEQKAAPAPVAEPPDLTVPDDVCELVSKAAALIAQAPQIVKSAASGITVNVGSGSDQRKTVKTITTRRDAEGNLVAQVTEQD